MVQHKSRHLHLAKYGERHIGRGSEALALSREGDVAASNVSIIQVIIGCTGSCQLWATLWAGFKFDRLQRCPLSTCASMTLSQWAGSISTDR